MPSKKVNTNRLANSSSPYLKQHAHNPVDWYPWGQEALDRARKEDKPLLISIGYSACHWCHVMERESFENETTAEIMNSSYVCIKVDREERPDVDQIYMDAVHAMGLQGGWPLNVFATPDQKPFYGGTYFRPQDWVQVLRGVANAFEKDRQKIEDSAMNFTQAIAQSEISKYGLERDEEAPTMAQIKQGTDRLIGKFDPLYGGLQKAPKFPMPAIWLFLQAYQRLVPSEKIHSHLTLTLAKMANGGIYDQLLGGFARYSVDERWFAPHFEKMLYDNGQLLTLYARDFRNNNNDESKRIIVGIMEWVMTEMTNEDGGFYSALDADSEGVEGKFYTWTSDEIDSTIKDSDVFKDFYGIVPDGNWEGGRSILHRAVSPPEFAAKHGLEIQDLLKILMEYSTGLLEVRNKRVRPGLDDKTISGWNGLMISGIVEAYISTEEEEYLEAARRNAEYLRRFIDQGSNLARLKSPEIEGMLEDYAFVISAFIDLYQVTFNTEYLSTARGLLQNAEEKFYDPEEKLFYYTSNTSSDLLTRKKDLLDNVIPASNSQMAVNLWRLGHFFDQSEWIEMAREMVRVVKKLIVTDVEYLANWARLALSMNNPMPEIVIVGPTSSKLSAELQKSLKYPFYIMAGSREESTALPLLEGRTAVDGRDTIYVCYNMTCKLPVHTVGEALELIETGNA